MLKRDNDFQQNQITFLCRAKYKHTIMSQKITKDLTELLEAGVQLCPCETLLTKEHLDELDQLGLPALPWVVNDVARMQELLNVGVNGITTDYPDRLIPLLS